jgi:2-phosphosulfolactate phosphatase
MADQRQVQVHLLPNLVPAGGLRGATAVAIDVLRSTRTMITALVAGCTDIRPCGTVEEARELAGGLRAGRAILGGEKHNLRIEGFDLGNSPLEYTAEACQGKTLVITTSNGVHAVLRAVEAERVLVAGFVKFSAVCEELRQDPRPIHILCAGTDGAVTLEDTLLAGALVDYLSQKFDARLNDSARLAWDGFKQRGSCLLAALQMSDGAQGLYEHDHGRDIEFAAEVDRFHLVPELRRDPLRVEAGASGVVPSHWHREPLAVGAPRHPAHEDVDAGVPAK